MPALHQSIFTDRMIFLMPNQQSQRTKGKKWLTSAHLKKMTIKTVHVCEKFHDYNVLGGGA